MKRKMLLAATLLLVSTTALAQIPPHAPMPPGSGHDPIESQLFPPDLIMRNQSELNLSDSQRAALRTEITKLQMRVVDLQWQIGDEADRLAKMVRATPIDEAKTLEQSDKVMSLEREIKRLHLGTLIRIKNLLTADQIAKLQEMRRAAARPGQ